MTEFEQNDARQTQKRESARTYVVLDGSKVVAYYTIVFGGIEWKNTPEKVRKGLGKYPIPIIFMARSAVDRKWSGKGLDNRLLSGNRIYTMTEIDI